GEPSSCKRVPTCDQTPGVILNCCDCPAAPCNDNNPCTENDRCDPGTMRVKGDPIGCDDGDPCTNDFCDQTRCEDNRRDPSMACVHRPKDCPPLARCMPQRCVGGDCVAAPIDDCCRSDQQ